MDEGNSFSTTLIRLRSTVTQSSHSPSCRFLPHAVNCVLVLFWALSVAFLFVYEISREPLNGFVPNSQGRRVWSLARTTLNVKVKGQRWGSPGTKKCIFGPFGGLRAVYVW